PLSSSWRGSPLERLEPHAPGLGTPFPGRSARGSGEEAFEPLPQRGPEHGEGPSVGGGRRASCSPPAAPGTREKSRWASAAAPPTPPACPYPSSASGPLAP